ncbi:hypothetical protein T484DRAFT_1889595, partial [Baffinella frigidus]
MNSPLTREQQERIARNKENAIRNQAIVREMTDKGAVRDSSGQGWWEPDETEAGRTFWTNHTLHKTCWKLPQTTPGGPSSSQTPPRPAQQAPAHRPAQPPAEPAARAPSSNSTSPGTEPAMSSPGGLPREQQDHIARSRDCHGAPGAPHGAGAAAMETEYVDVDELAAIEMAMSMAPAATPPRPTSGAVRAPTSTPDRSSASAGQPPGGGGFPTRGTPPRGGAGGQG